MSSGHDDHRFAQLVSLACHDLRTPLATVTGFVRTLPRLIETDERGRRYLELIDAGATQLGELLEDLALAARIEGGRYEPLLRAADALELARAAAERTSDGAVDVRGAGGEVLVEPEAAIRALAHLARCALRHGALERVELTAAGSNLALAPVGPEVAPILLGDNLRDLGAAVGVRVIAAFGGSVVVAAEAAEISLPSAAAG